MDRNIRFIPKMIDKKNFKKAIAQPLEKAGFKKKGQSGYLIGPDTIVSLSLQKSDWWELYFIELDIQLASTKDDKLPPKGDFLFSHRLGEIFQDKQEMIHKGSSLDTGDLESLVRLSYFIESDVVPFLKECTSFEKLREKLNAGIFRKGLITAKAKELLGENSS